MNDTFSGGNKTRPNGANRRNIQSLWQRWFPRTLLAWDEPRALPVGRHAPRKRRLRRILLTVAVAGWIAAWTFSRLFPGLDLTGVLSALASLALIALLSPWAQHAAHCRVTLSEAGITQAVADDTSSTWPYKAIDHCEITHARSGDDTERFLIIELRRGRRVTIGIAPRVSPADLQNVLESQDVKVLSGPELIRLPDNPTGMALWKMPHGQ